MNDTERSQVVDAIETLTGKTPVVRWSSSQEDWVAEEGQEPGDHYARNDSPDSALLSLLLAIARVKAGASTRPVDLPQPAEPTMDLLA